MSAASTNGNGTNTLYRYIGAIAIIFGLAGGLWALAIRPQESEISNIKGTLSEVKAESKEGDKELDERLQREMRDLDALRDVKAGALEQRIEENEEWRKGPGMQMIYNLAELNARVKALEQQKGNQ